MLRPRSLEPGQRSEVLDSHAAEQVASAQGLADLPDLRGELSKPGSLASTPRRLLQGTPEEGLLALKVLRVVEIRPIPPKASGKPECPKSSNQPVRSGL